MFAIEIFTVFSAAHALRLPGGGLEPLHGHDFGVTVRIGAEELDGMETVVDFHVVEEALVGIVMAWRNRNLNEIAPFDGAVNPSAERIAERIGRGMEGALVALAKAKKIERGSERGVRVMEVRVTEAVGCVGVWVGG